MENRSNFILIFVGICFIISLLSYGIFQISDNIRNPVQEYMEPGDVSIQPIKAGEIGVTAVGLILCVNPGDVILINKSRDNYTADEYYYNFVEHKKGFMIQQGTSVEVLKIYLRIVEVKVIEKGPQQGLTGFTDPEYIMKVDHQGGVL